LHQAGNVQSGPPHTRQPAFFCATDYQVKMTCGLISAMRDMFILDDDGKVISLKVLQSSALPDVDDAALRSIQSGQPLQRPRD
jgi:hypothetical protein